MASHVVTQYTSLMASHVVIIIFYFYEARDTSNKNTLQFARLGGEAGIAVASPGES